MKCGEQPLLLDSSNEAVDVVPGLADFAVIFAVEMEREADQLVVSRPPW